MQRCPRTAREVFDRRVTLVKIGKPADIATRETLAFVSANVPAGASVLEAGCGAGHLARALLEAGYRVLALDSDAAEVAQARGRGVDARCIEWPDFHEGPFDAIAFTRSLHHMNPLDEAVRRAHELLRPDGVLIVEDFAFVETSGATIDWFAALLNRPEVRALLEPTPGEMVAFLVEPGADPRKTWHGRHDHALHTWPAMSEAVGRRFAVGPPQIVPYLYRYLVRATPATPRAAAMVEAAFAEESRLGARREIDLIGRRLVARPRFSPAD
jgi:SAM-dependent methyltransferase